MSRFDDALGGIKMPTTDDLQITLPPRREPKPAAEPAGAPTEGRDVGQHGGGAETPGDTSSTAADSTPLPQRDEPDEGEHTDSTQEQMDQRALRADTSTEEPVKPRDEAGHREASDVMASEDIEMPSTESDEPVESIPTTLERALTSTEGKTPRSRVRAAFSPGAHTPTLTVKRFPQPLVDKLRILIAPKLGGEFAETISASALVSAFLVAQLGVDLDFDESTAAAVDAFRDEDQRVTVIEDRIELALQSIDQLAQATRLGLKRVSEVGVTTDSIDFAVSYLLTDRVAGLSTADVNESNVDVTQKKVLAARSRVRAAAKAQRTIEQHDQMRSNR